MFLFLIHKLQFLSIFLRYVYLLVAGGSSGILKGKQKLGVTFNSDKLSGIDFTNFSKTDDVQCLGGSLDIDFSKNLVCKV